MHRTKLIFIRFIAFFMVASITMAGTGLHFFYHHCYTSGQHDFVISLPLTFQSNQDLHNHCHCAPSDTNETKCEHCTAPAENSKTEQENHIDCCKMESKIVQLHTEYTISQTPPVNSPVQICLFNHSFEELPEMEENQFGTILNQFPDIPPKPQYGKILLTSLHQLKIHIS